VGRESWFARRFDSRGGKVIACRKTNPTVVQVDHDDTDWRLVLEKKKKKLWNPRVLRLNVSARSLIRFTRRRF
jgi:hypothetical protein